MKPRSHSHSAADSQSRTDRRDTLKHTHTQSAHSNCVNELLEETMTTPPRTSEMSPRDRSPVRTSSPRHPSGKDPWNQWTTYTLTLLQLEQTTDSSGRRGTGPPTEPGFSQGFFSILSPMEFSFLAAVASGLLSWGHFISSTIIDLIAQIF